MTRTLPGTPAADGFHMPGEFEAHERSWLIWPERPDIWRERELPAQHSHRLSFPARAQAQ